MRRAAAIARTAKYLVEHCEIVDPSHTPDGLGGWSTDNAGTTIYSGPCFVSPGNMWPFEMPEGGRRTGRGDLLFRVPRSVEDISLESVVIWNQEEYEVIGFNTAPTAMATLEITARRIKS